MGKTLVAYFSASGSTARLAETMAQAANADLFEIQPVMKYTSADLNWNNPSSRSSVEMADRASRVEITNTVGSMTDYDTILIGYPIWWGEAPHIINTFLESYDMTGKTVIPFATSGGSGIGNTNAYLGSSAKGAVLRTGKLFRWNTSVSEIEKWLKRQ